MYPAIIGFVAFAGGAFAGWLGWRKSGEDWDWKKYQVTLATSFVTALSITFYFTYSETLDFKDYILAFLTGAGMDNLVNRVMK